MAGDGTKRTDVRLAVIVAGVILAVGLSIMSGLWLVLRAKSGPDRCPGRVLVGVAAQVRQRIIDEGPFLGRGGACGSFWAAVEGDRLVAVRTDVVGRRCPVAWSIRRKGWVCGGAPLAPNEVRYWPSTVLRGGATDGAWQIDFSRG